MPRVQKDGSFIYSQSGHAHRFSWAFLTILSHVYKQQEKKISNLQIHPSKKKKKTKTKTFRNEGGLAILET